MNKLRKGFVFVILLIVGYASAFAYDEDSSVFIYFNNVPRSVYEDAMKSQIFEEQTIYQIIGFSSSFSNFSQIDMDNMSEEEMQMYRFAVAHVTNKAQKNDIYVSIVIKNIDLLAGTFDGWGIISHVVAKDDVLSKAYYFSAEF